MLRISSVLLTIVAIGAGLLGLLFWIGSAGQIHRLVVGTSLLAVAVVLGLVARKLAQAAHQSSRVVIVAELLSLAQQNNGLLTEALIAAHFGARSLRTINVLQDLARSGQCRQVQKAGIVSYLFSELSVQLTVPKCAHCGFESTLVDIPEGSTCPRCGAVLSWTRRTADPSVEPDAYRLDE
jgi:hypothetical protein